MKAKSQFEFVPRDTDESEFLDLVDLGGVAFSVETVIWGGISGDEDSRNVVSDMAYSHISHVMWHDVSISVTWRTRDTTYPYVWRDSSICVTCLHVTWRMHRCDTTYSHRCDMQYIRGLFGDEEHILRHDALSFISRDMMFPHVWHDIHVTWRIHMCDMTRPYAWKASLAPRIWFLFLFLSIYSILQCADPRASATQGFPCVCAVFHSSSCSVTLPRASPGPWLIFSISWLIFSIHDSSSVFHDSSSVFTYQRDTGCSIYVCAVFRLFHAPWLIQKPRDTPRHITSSSSMCQCVTGISICAMFRPL